MEQVSRGSAPDPRPLRELTALHGPTPSRWGKGLAATCPWAAPQVLNRVCLFPLPPLPFLPIPFPTLLPPSFPPFPSPPFPSRVEGSQSHLPLPSLALPSLFPFPRGSHPLNQLGGLGERYKLPQWGLGRSPSRQTIWCISGPKEAALVATVFVHFIRIKSINVIFCDFDAEGSIKFSLP